MGENVQRKPDVHHHHGAVSSRRPILVRLLGIDPGSRAVGLPSRGLGIKRQRSFVIWSNAEPARRALLWVARLLPAAVFAAVVALVVTAAPVFADQPGQFLEYDLSVAPPTPVLVPANPGPHGYFEYTLSPGQSTDGSAMVRNPGGAPATFALYPTDATTSTATGAVYGGLADTPRATGSWIHLAAHRVVFGPGQSQVVPFHLIVPAGTPPGDHIGGFSAENPVAVHQNSTGGGVAFNVNTRVVVAVVVHVPGAAAVAIQLGKPALVAQNGNQQVITFPMNDTGGLLAKPTFAATVGRCATGPALAALSRHLDTFVPRTAIVYNWPLGQLVLAAGCYRVTGTLTNLGSILSTVTADIVVTSAQASVTPPSGPHSIRQPRAWTLILIAIGAGVLLAVILVLWWRSRRRRLHLEEELARLKDAANPPQP
jgi:hypothetical protein